MAVALEDKFDEVRQLIVIGKEKGYLLYDEVNDLLPADLTANPEDLEELLATRLLVQGNSGSGKSHLLRRLLEQSAPWVQQAIQATNDEVLQGKVEVPFTAQSRCYPGGVPGQLLYPAEPFYFIQTPKEVVMIWAEDHQVRRIYKPFTPEEISAKIVELVRPKHLAWPGKFELIFQSIEGLHDAVPHHRGDWYFTGDYPTPGGLAVLNRAYMNYWEKREGRAY